MLFSAFADALGTMSLHHITPQSLILKLCMEEKPIFLCLVFVSLVKLATYVYFSVLISVSKKTESPAKETIDKVENNVINTRIKAISRDKI